MQRNPVADRDEDRTRTARRSRRVSLHASAELNREHMLRAASFRLHPTDQWMLRDADRREAEADPAVARDAEQGRMEAAMSAYQEHVRSARQPTDSGFDPGRFAVGQVRPTLR